MGATAELVIEKLCSNDCGDRKVQFLTVKPAQQSNVDNFEPLSLVIVWTRWMTEHVLRMWVFKSMIQPVDKHTGCALYFFKV